MAAVPGASLSVQSRCHNKTVEHGALRSSVEEAIDLPIATTRISSIKPVSISMQTKSFPSLRMQPRHFQVSCAAKPETVDKVISIVRKQLALPAESAVTGESKFAALGADSLDTVEIVMSLEEAFGITVEEENAQTIATVADAAEVIEKLVAENACIFSEMDVHRLLAKMYSGWVLGIFDSSTWANEGERMLQLDKPHSWWFDSDTGPRRSVWLQSTISDLDEKMKAMLRLIEEDGDSFAQRAEMFYKRRPELVTMVGDFYRMHRSLAEGFDQLKSEARNRLIKPFTPPIQARKLLKMEKLYDSYSRDSVHPEQDEHLHSYVGVEDEDYAESEVDDPEVDDPEQENDTNVHGIQMRYNDECGEDFDVDYSEQDHENPVAVEKFSSIHRDGEVLMLQAEVEKLKEENMILKEQLHDEYLGLIQEIEVAKLRGEMERLKEENMILKDEIETLKEENRAQKEKQESSNLIHESEAAKLRDEIVRLKVENVIHKDQLESSCLIHESEVAKLRDEIASLKSENKFREEREPDQSHGSINENEIAKAMDEVESGTSENMSSGGKRF
ncbi:hypothetical protein Syun_007794 [Stephania yunnanensis]|uniref:Acyl carrier protein n=1 Tax=Stephania yunnanensis TaxID=152371 RepID=A0AAP0PZ31_9MAGN